MDNRQLDSLLVHAFDGCQQAGHEPHIINDDFLCGIWWTLGVVRAAANDHPVGIKALQELGQGNIDLDGMSDFVKGQ